MRKYESFNFWFFSLLILSVNFFAGVSTWANIILKSNKLTRSMNCWCSLANDGIVAVLLVQAKCWIRIAVAEESQYITDFYDFIAVYLLDKCWGSSHLISSCPLIAIVFPFFLSFSLTFYSHRISGGFFICLSALHPFKCVKVKILCVCVSDLLWITGYRKFIRINNWILSIYLF